MKKEKKKKDKIRKLVSQRQSISFVDYAAFEEDGGNVSDF